MSRIRKTYGPSHRLAECRRCGKRWTGPNALAVAARHVDAFGCSVTVECSFTATYAPPLKRSAP